MSPLKENEQGHGRKVSFFRWKGKELAVIAIALCVTILSVFIVRHVNTLVLDASYERALDGTRKGAEIFRLGLRQSEEKLHLLSDLLPDDPSLWKGELARFNKNGLFVTLAIVCASGEIYSAAPVAPEQLAIWRKLEQSGSKSYIGSTGIRHVFFHLPVSSGHVRAHLYAECMIPKLYNDTGMDFLKDGVSFIISAKTGEFLLRSQSRNSQGLYSDLYSMLMDSEENPQEIVENLRTILQQARTGTTLMRFRGEMSYLCFVPLGENTDWYFLSITPQHAIERIGNETIFFIVCLVILCVFSSVLVFGIRRRSAVIASKYMERLDKENQLNTISSNMNAVVLVYSPAEGKTEFISRNCTRLLGISPEQGRNLEDLKRLFPLPDQRHFWENLRTLSTSIVQEFPYAKPDTAEQIWLKICVIQITETLSAGKYLITLEDCTQDRRKNQLLEQTMHEAQRANEAKTLFLTNMSHEIRTPMNAIIGMASLAEVNIHNPAVVEDCLKKVATASQHLLTLINDVLDMSRIASGKMTFAAEPFSLAEVIDEVLTLILPLLRAREQTLKTALEGDCDHLFIGDAFRIRQVLINLLSNAIKYTPEKGLIQLSVSRNMDTLPPELQFVISDNGIGMSEDFQQHIFEPFSQESLTSSGTGLGMAIVSNLVSSMKGSIALRSRKGEGSTFTLALPLPVADEDQPPCPEALSAHHVLVVAGDDATVRQHILPSLEKTGITLRWCTAGVDALHILDAAVAEQDPFDAVFIDEDITIQEGMDFIDRLAERAGVKLFLVAYDGLSLHDKAEHHGLTGIIAKPLFVSRLCRSLMPVQDRSASPPRDATLAGKHVLLAEDNELNIIVAVRMLNILGAAVETARNGREAVARFSEGRPGCFDFILMDIRMPQCDGYEATRLIRQLNREDAKNIPVIAMTANAFAEDREKALNAGMNGFITKPINLKDLQKKLLEILRGTTSGL